MTVMLYDPKETYWQFTADVSLGDLIDNDLEGFLDLNRETATGTIRLMDLNYGIAGVAPGAGGTVDGLGVNGIRLWVSGDCSEIFDDLIDDLPEGSDEAAEDAAIVAFLTEHKAQPVR
jgi:hypothetical protein